VTEEQMMQFLVEKGHINKRQHAFIKHHFTASNLLECVGDWSIDLNFSKQTAVFYIDFAKAVPSKPLLKPETYGFSSPSLIG
jgi:hypothetical protein